MTGGAIGSLLGQVLPESPSERKVLLAAGAAAGMAATFGTPLAAVILALVGLVEPRALGVGYDVIGDVLSGRLALGVLAVDRRPGVRAGCDGRRGDEACPLTDVASSDVVTVAPEDDLLAALRLILDEEVEHLPVVSDGRVVGHLYANGHPRCSATPVRARAAAARLASNGSPGLGVLAAAAGGAPPVSPGGPGSPR